MARLATDTIINYQSAIINLQSSLDFKSIIRRPRRSGQILWPDLVQIHLSSAVLHRLQHFFDGRRFTLDPAQWIDAGDYECPQIGTYESPVFQLQYSGRNFFF